MATGEAQSQRRQFDKCFTDQPLGPLLCEIDAQKPVAAGGVIFSSAACLRVKLVFLLPVQSIAG